MNIGKRWTQEEDIQLLEDVVNNIDVFKIAINHGRKIGGITCRIEDIAYKMYINGIEMNEIETKTKLTNKKIKDIIEKKKDKLDQKDKLDNEKEKRNELFPEIIKLQQEMNIVKEELNTIKTDIHMLTRDIKDILLIVRNICGNSENYI